MDLQWFLKLKEYDSLTKMRINHLKALNEQEGRITSLNEKRQNTVSEIERLNHESNSLGQLLFETEKKIAEADQQKKRVIELGSDENKIKAFEKTINDGETIFFELMAKQEQLEVEKNDLKTFLNGIQNTIIEITKEVDEEKPKELNNISNLDLRLKLLFEEMPEEFRNLLVKTTNKKLSLGPFTRVDTGSCYICRSKLSKLEESEIDIQHLLKTCKMCQRIFLPYGA